MRTSLLLNPIKWFFHLLIGQFQLGVVGASGGETAVDTETQMQQLVDSILSATTTETGTTEATSDALTQRLMESLTGTQAETGIAEDVAQRLGEGYGQYSSLVGSLPAEDIIGQGRETIAAGEELVPGALQAYSRALTGGNVAEDPQLAAAINAAIDPVYQRLTQDILPGITDQEVMAGAVGGSGGEIAESLALQDFMREAGNISSGMTYDALQAGKAREFQAAQNINDLISGLGGGAAAKLGLTGAGGSVLDQYLRTLQADPRRTQMSQQQQTQQSAEQLQQRQMEEERRRREEQRRQQQETIGQESQQQAESGWNLGLSFG